MDTTGIDCPERPVGVEIAACTTQPHGAVHTVLSPTICQSGPEALMPIPGGHGGLYDCLAERVAVGGYGYTTSSDHLTSLILIQPESHLQRFDVEATGVEIVNVSAITGIFGKSYIEAFVHAPPRQDAAAITIMVVLSSLLLSLLVIHLGLVYYSESTVLMLGAKEKVE